MEAKIEAAIDVLLTRGFAAGTCPKPEDAVKMSQAVLNLFQARNMERLKK